MAKYWFPQGRNNDNGWRLDIVSLLAVIGESSIESHSQALTSSWTCILPRIIPAPQVLLKPSRPTRMPVTNATVVGVHNGTSVPSLNYFPNIIHPLDDLKQFEFKVIRIKHKGQPDVGQQLHISTEKLSSRNDFSTSASMDIGIMESGMPSPPDRPTIRRTFTRMVTMHEKDKPRVPPQFFSPLNVLSVLSFVTTIGLIIWAALIKDGTAVVALGTISLVSSVVGYASWWEPILMKRNFKSKVPAGDVIIRTREGAFLLVVCDEDVARELYTGTEECQYYVGTQTYRLLVGLGTFLLMVSVVLLGNCSFPMQAAVGTSYIILNGSFWGASLIPKKRFWNLSNYDFKVVTPPDAVDADKAQAETLEGRASFTRTMWYAIRETKKIGWVKRSGAAPSTHEWELWLKLAEENAVAGKRTWNAVEMRESIVGQAESSNPKSPIGKDLAEQHVPAQVIDAPQAR
ncbi:uncharacterized protein LY89DRAFT_576597 [Mollisia scopiformis]|uniref:Uncharacterized protein n=1 Tax=Mollisia scopiformis TaxID=149040 RepID=A0A194XNH0_MOLSC|nr:uncharacterized protein LY89DRAFT_576597 [Mollisia scopiformis]KUJ21790.1 hypothetical protein LY89DRAFT_576597 [Mollisia scopiformis]